MNKLSIRLCSLIVAVGVVMPLGMSTPASAAVNNVKQAQTIMSKYGIPTGTVDGKFGPETGRGLCAFRYMSGITPSRAGVDSKTLAKLQAFNKKYKTLQDIPAATKSKQATYLVAHETCQAMFYVEKNHFKRVMAISTGVKGHTTPNGTFTLGDTDRSWRCSKLYPESCTKHTEGRFLKPRDFGNMYNRRTVSGDIFVHGSISVPPRPASHGCIRVTIADSDWMFDHVGNGANPKIFVVGAFKA